MSIAPAFAARLWIQKFEYFRSRAGPETAKSGGDSYGANHDSSCRPGRNAEAVARWVYDINLIDVGRELYGDMLNLVVWNESNAGQGSFYRSQHELIGVFRVGGHPHRNDVELGRFGRNRSNVWTYAGINAFGRDRLEALAAHPTLKPVMLVGDALLDCTGRGDGVLDQFAGSGTTILAAEKVGRTGFGCEPGYVDVAIRRWQKSTKLGRSFEEIGAARSNSNDAPQHDHLKPDASQAQAKRVADPKAATALGGEGAYGGR